MSDVSQNVRTLAFLCAVWGQVLFCWVSWPLMASDHRNRCWAFSIILIWKIFIIFTWGFPWIRSNMMSLSPAHCSGTAWRFRAWCSGSCFAVTVRREKERKTAPNQWNSSGITSLAVCGQSPIRSNPREGHRVCSVITDCMLLTYFSHTHPLVLFLAFLWHQDLIASILISNIVVLNVVF